MHSHSSMRLQSKDKSGSRGSHTFPGHAIRRNEYSAVRFANVVAKIPPRRAQARAWRNVKKPPR